MFSLKAKIDSNIFDKNSLQYYVCYSNPKTKVMGLKSLIKQTEEKGNKEE